MKKTTILLALLLLPAAPASAAPPSNDGWQQAQEISSFPARVTIDLSEATTGDHEQDCGTGSNSVTQPATAVWFRLTATERSRLLVGDKGLSGYHPFDLWRPSVDTLGSPTLVRESCEAWFEDYLYEGGIYYIAFKDNGDPEPFDLIFDLQSPGPAPRNDVPYRATTIDALPFETTEATYRATYDTDDVICPSQDGQVWFSFVPDHTMAVAFEVDGLFSGGSLAAFEEGSDLSLACTDGSPGTATAQLRAGKKVLINVGDYYGHVTLRMREVARRDDLADAVPLTADEDASFDTIGSTLEPGEPAPCGTGGSVWFSIAPSAMSGSVAATADGGLSLALYDGDAISNLSLAGCSTNGSLTIAPSGTQRYLQVRGEGVRGTIAFTLGTLGIQVSDASPFAAGCGDDTDTFYPDSEVEVSEAVDPTDPDHLVTAWQQDRHRDRGGARGIAAAVSHDGGASWATSVIPGLSQCSGGPYRRATDPWVSIGADGTAYVMSLAYNADLVYPSTVRSNNIFGAGGVFVSRSNDGGRTWEAPVTVASSPGMVFNDKNTMTADPNDPDRLYLTWAQVVGTGVASMFSRSDDGGRTWLPPIPLPTGGVAASGDQIAVLDDGALVHVTNNRVVGRFQSMTSRDGGVTWALPVEIAPSQGGEGPPVVRGGGFLPSVATDGANVHVSWSGPYESYLATSTDAGTTWIVRTVVDCCVPIFTSTVAVTDAGVIGITAYTFPSEYFTTQIRLSTSPDGGLTWTHREVTSAFDIARAPYSARRGYFLGDYMGLVASGDSFVATYGAVPVGTDHSVSNVYAQRLTP